MRDLAAEQARDRVEDARRTQSPDARARVAIRRPLRLPRGGSMPVECGCEALLVVVRPALDDRVRGESSRDERLVHAVARERVDEAGGVADEEDPAPRRRGAELAHRQAMAPDLREERRVDLVLAGEPVEMAPEPGAFGHPSPHAE